MLRRVERTRPGACTSAARAASARPLPVSDDDADLCFFRPEWRNLLLPGRKISRQEDPGARATLSQSAVANPPPLHGHQISARVFYPERNSSSSRPSVGGPGPLEERAAAPPPSSPPGRARAVAALARLLSTTTHATSTMQALTFATRPGAIASRNPTTRATVSARRGPASAIRASAAAPAAAVEASEVDFAAYIKEKNAAIEEALSESVPRCTLSACTSPCAILSSPAASASARA